MAITITQDPTSPNMTNNTLVYNVISGQISQAQFQYVADIRDAGGTLIQRIKQQPNPSGRGIFDVGMICTYNVGPCDRIWDIPSDTVSPNSNTAAEFNIYFGEEYASSVSGSPTVYTGIGVTTGNPAISASEYLYGIDGLVNPNEKTKWNWNSGSKYDEEIIDDITFFHQNGLTNFDSSSVRLGDYHSISILNGNVNGLAPTTASAQEVFAMHVRQYDENNSLISESVSYNGSYPARTQIGPDQFDVWNTCYTSQSAATRLLHWGVGPQNLEDGNQPLSSSAAYYTVEFQAQQTDGTPNPDGLFGLYRFDITDKNCGYDGVRFAWKNKYGVWDYFNFGLAETTTPEITRETYKQTFLNFSNSSYNVAYNKERRGTTNFLNMVSKKRTAESDYLTQSEADEIQEMFYSADVYVQDGNNFLPVTIGNVNITEKTNPRTQKLFRYRVEYQYANDQRNRL